jgi:hypothetical protein
MKHKLLFLHVASQEADSDCRIKGSLRVPFKELDVFVEQHKKVRSELELIIYSATNQSHEVHDVWRQLREQGFNAKVLEGGLCVWINKGFPSEGLCRASYLKEAEPISHYQEHKSVMISVEDAKKKMDGVA